MQAQGRTARRSRCRWVLISTDVRPPPFGLSHSSLALRASLVRQVAEARRLLAGAPDDDVVASRQERQVTILVRTTKRR